MPNTIPIDEWLKFIDTEYLSSFVSDGGASVKFVVTPEELKPDLYTKMETRCRDKDYLFVRFDAREMRAHMPQDFFFSLARQVDWRRLARRVIQRLAAELRYPSEAISTDVADNVFDAIASANGLETQSLRMVIRPEIQDRVFKNTKMARDFRVCMFQFCLKEDARGEYDGQPLLDWLTGVNTRVSNVRQFAIHTTINRTTARHFIESAFYWIRYAGYAGTVILLDNSRVTLARRPKPKDNLKYYTRPMAIDHYELLREFIDSVDRLTGALMVIVTNRDFLNSDAGRGSRGYGIYPALLTRVIDDVRDRNRVNPIASLVRLS